MVGGRIFISYRRGVDSGSAGRLFEIMSTAFGAERIFFDVDSIPPGVDFVEFLNEQVMQCDAMLIVIGQGWLESTARFEHDADFLRLEIEAALYHNKFTIPVLVDGAQMPAPHQLPETLETLTRRNALVVSHENFRASAARLVDTVKGALQYQDDEPSSEPNAEQKIDSSTHAETPFDTHSTVKSTGPLARAVNTVLSTMGWQIVPLRSDQTVLPAPITPTPNTPEKDYRQYVTEHEPELRAEIEHRRTEARAAQFATQTAYFEMEAPPKLFLSYSRKDAVWRDRFEQMLSPMLRKSSIMLWTDREIEDGRWRDQIDEAMKDAAAALFLVSTNSLSSDFIMDTELPTLLRAADERGLSVTWVPIDHALWEETDLSEQSAAIDPSGPLSSLSSPEQNRVIKQICLGIRGRLLSSVSDSQ